MFRPETRVRRPRTNPEVRPWQLYCNYVVEWRSRSGRKRAKPDVDIFEAEQQRFEDIFTSAEKKLAEVAPGEHATENMRIVSCIQPGHC